MKPALHEFIALHAGRKMLWGENDCCLVASDWIARVTGFDPMADLRGSYVGWKQAARVWRALGGVENAVSTRLDARFRRVPLSWVERGDVCLVKTHNRASTCAIVDTCGVWLPTKAGYKLIRGLNQITTFWRIE